jgi:uncharacterized cupin superfamily protein
MVPEAPLEHVDNGLEPAGDGWFVLNVREGRWFDGPLGMGVELESERAPFEQVGFNIGILRPDEPGGMYHGEDAQEDFLILAGECLLLIEGEERRLRAWDFVHCPPWTEHTFVGAGDGPCLILGVGARHEGKRIRYPVSELARRYGAGVEQETTDPREAYARFSGLEAVPPPPELPPR